MSAWRLARKDFAITLYDRVGLALTFLLPIVLATVMGTAMGAISGGDSDGPRVSIRVEDRDGSEASRALVDALAAAKGLRVRRVETAAVEADGEGSARDGVAQGDVPAGLVVPSGFGERVSSDQDPGLVLYRDPGATLEQRLLLAALVPALLEVMGEGLAERALTRSLDQLPLTDAFRASARAVLQRSWNDMDALIDTADADGGLMADGGAGFDLGDIDLGAALGGVLGLQVEDVVGGDDDEQAEQLAAKVQAVAGIAVMMLLFGLIAAGGTLLDEEASGTLERLRLAPGAGRSILTGKFLFTAAIGLAQLAVLFLYARLVFGLPLARAPLALLVHVLALTAAATGFGILFAVVCRSRKQLEGISTLVILAMSAFGGAWWPLAITPEWYQKLAHFTLTAWGMDGFQAIFWYDLGLAGVAKPALVLAAIALVTAFLAAILWRRRMRAL